MSQILLYTCDKCGIKSYGEMNRFGHVIWGENAPHLCAICLERWKEKYNNSRLHKEMYNIPAKEYARRYEAMFKRWMGTAAVRRWLGGKPEKVIFN